MMKKAQTPAPAPPHPGDVLMERIEALGLSPNYVGVATGARSAGIYQIIHDAGFGGRNRRGISAKMALRLAKFFGDDPRFWLGLQNEYDLHQALEEFTFSEELATIPRYGEKHSVGLKKTSK